MIWNVVDGRERRYRWAKINAVIESTCHDNTCQDADIAPEPDDDSHVYEARSGISLREAIDWAHHQSVPVTLFLYDHETPV